MTPARPPGAARAVAVILGARWRAWRRSVRSPGARLGLLVVVAVLGGIAVGGYAGARGTTRLLAAHAGPVLAELAARGAAPPTADELLALLPSLVFTIAGVSVLFVSFGTLLAGLYLGGDLPRRLTAPVPVRAVFAATFLEAALTPVGLTLVIGLPILAGYSAGRGYGPAAPIMAAVLLTALPLGLLGVAALLAMALVRVLSPRRVNELLKVVGTALGVALWWSTQAWSVGDPGAADALGSLAASRWAEALAPARWLVRALDAAGAGNAAEALLWGALCLAPAAAALGAGLLAAERLYLAGWARGETRARRAPRRAGGADPLRRIAAPAVAAIARKDWRVMRRDARGLSRLVFPVVLAVFWSWQALQARGMPELGGTAQLLHALAPAIALLALGSLAVQFAQEGLSRDRHSASLVLTSPVTPAQIALGKGLAALAPTLGLGLGLVAVFALAAGTPAPRAAANAAIVALGLLGQTAIGLAFGAAEPRFDWTDPRRMVGQTRGCLGGLVVFGFDIALLGAGLGPIVAADVLGLPAWVGALGLLLAAAVAAGTTVVAGLSAVRAFGRVEM